MNKPIAKSMSLKNGTPTSITAIFTDKNIAASVEDDNWTQMLTAYREEDWDTLISLSEPIVKVEEFFADYGDIVIDAPCIYYLDPATGNKCEIHNVVVDKIFEFIDAGENAAPLINFLSKLMKNPSSSSVAELYTFLDREHLAITDDGDFVAYKSVRADYTDQYSGTILNLPGSTHKMIRSFVDDDRNVGCSFGYHVGAYEYARTFGGYDRRVMLVRVNPANVVSVPIECSFQKVRVSEYTVISEMIDQSSPLTTPVWHDEEPEPDENCEPWCKCDECVEYRDSLCPIWRKCFDYDNEECDPIHDGLCDDMKSQI